MSREFTATARLAAVAARDVTIRLAIPLASLPRLAAEQDDAGGGRQVELMLTAAPVSVAGTSFRRLAGDARLTWLTRCQRTLVPLALPIVAPIDIVLGDEEGLDDTGEAWDVWPGDEAVTLGEVVEEYVLLALPLVPVAADGGSDAVAAAEMNDGETAPPKRRPFADLADLMRDAGDSAAARAPSDDGDET